MDGLKTYLELTEHGRPCDEAPELATPQTALIDLLQWARTQGRLRVDGPWRLAASEARALEERTGYSPAGGWDAVAGLAAGCDVLEATREGFVPIGNVEELAAESDGCRRRMLEAFTRHLVPPRAAASIFVLLGIHPLWGLELARQSGAQTTLSADANALLPAERLEAVHTAAFGLIACLLAVLRSLEPDHRYPVDALAPVVWAACGCARELASSLLGEAAAGTLPVFLDMTDDEGPAHARRLHDLTVHDLLDCVFVPAGVVRRADDASFVVAPRALDAVVVGGWDVSEQETWLGWLTTAQPRFLCA